MFNVTITTAIIFLNIIMLPLQIGKGACFCEEGTTCLYINVMELEGLTIT